MADGVWTKSGDKTRRYVGTFMPTGPTTTEDSNVSRLLYSANNRVVRSSITQDTATWDYANAAWAAMDSGSVNTNWRHFYVLGLDEDVMEAEATAYQTTNGVALLSFWINNGGGGIPHPLATVAQNVGFSVTTMLRGR